MKLVLSVSEQLKDIILNSEFRWWDLTKEFFEITFNTSLVFESAVIWSTNTLYLTILPTFY